MDGQKIGIVTSGGFGPSLNGPCAMGYVEAAHSALGSSVHLIVRGTPMPAKIVAMPFVPHRFHRT
jgi:aminomethyltransferase